MIRGVIFALLLLAAGRPAQAQQAGDPDSLSPQPLPFELDVEAPDEAVPPAEVSFDLFARDSYRIDTVVCPFKGEIDYEPGDVECGLLQVPENREDPESRTIELHFVKLVSRAGRETADEESDRKKVDWTRPAPGRRNDPVVYLTGGPGAQVTGYVKRLKDHGLLDHRDMYILEQRGIGYSADFCPFFDSRKPELNDLPGFEESLRASVERIADCARNATAAGVDLRGYNTIENARDVKALRRALGFEQWNVWGISYGSILGQAYVKEDPDGILAFVIDAIMPLDIRDSELYWRVANWYDRDLRMLQEICDGQPDCARRYPDIGGKLREAILSVIGNPIEVEVEDSESYPSGKAHAFQDIVAYLPFMLLYEQDNYPGIPGLVYAWSDAVLARDETLFKALAAAMGDGGFGTGSPGMANAVFCLDGDAEAQARAVKRDLVEHPLLGAALGTAEIWDLQVSQCAELGMPQRPAEQYAPLLTDIHGLVIEGAMDPITPPPNAEAIMPGLSNATYVEFPYAGHGPSRSVECAGDMLNLFYDDPTTEPNVECVDQMKEPRMFVPLFTSSVAPRLLLLAAGDRKRLVLPGAWLGVSAGVLLLAFLVLTFGPLMRRIDHRPRMPAGGARALSWLSASVSVAALATLGAAIAVTAQASEVLPLFGFVPWARWGAWLGLAAGPLGVITFIAALRAPRVARSRALGFALTGLAAVALSLFLYTWDLGPF